MRCKVREIWYFPYENILLSYICYKTILMGIAEGWLNSDIVPYKIYGQGEGGANRPAVFVFFIIVTSVYLGSIIKKTAVLSPMFKTSCHTTPSL